MLKKKTKSVKIHVEELSYGKKKIGKVLNESEFC